MIFGTAQPKLVIGSHVIDFNAGDEKLLIVQKDYNYQVRDGKLLKSILTGNREYKNKGDYAEFKLTVLCPGALSTDDFSTHYAEIQHSLKAGALVTLFPHADGSFNADCWVTEFKSFYYKNSTIYDAYKVTFKSKSYKSFSYNQTATPAADKPGYSFPFGESIGIRLSCTTANSQIYYTIDGSTPTKDSFEYKAFTSLIINATTTLKARAFSPGARWSKVMSETYIELPPT
jgi:Fn3 associated